MSDGNALAQLGTTAIRLVDAGKSRWELRNKEIFTRALCTYSMHVFSHGTARIRDGHKEQVIHGPNAIMIPAGQRLRMYTQDMSELWWFHFLVRHEPTWDSSINGRDFALHRDSRRQFLQPSPMELWATELPWSAPGPMPKGMVHAARNILHGWTATDPNQIVESHLILANVIHRWALLSRLQARQTPPIGKRLQATKLYAFAHIDRGLTVAGLAHHAGMERAHFTKAFDKHYRCPPGRWLRFLRLIRACSLIAHNRRLDEDEEETISLQDIALRSGFSDRPSLTRAYKQAFGLAPSAVNVEQGQGVTNKLIKNLKQAWQIPEQLVP